MAAAEPRLKSCLESGGGGEGPSLAQITASAKRRMMAEYRLEGMRQTLRYNSDLITACDAVCGMEQTPREAADNGVGAAKLEVALQIALDLIAKSLAEPKPR